MNRRVLEKVRARAGDRCEYCRVPRRFDPLPFQVDHIVAEQHGGRTILENLAWDMGSDPRPI
jgi:HNH endonuclease